MKKKARRLPLPESCGGSSEIDVFALTVLPLELLQAIAETVEIMSNKETMVQFRQSVLEMENGANIPWEQARKFLQGT